MKKIIFTALAALFFISCTSKTEKLQSKKEKLNHQNASTFYQNYVYSKVKTNQTELENYIKNLPLEKKIAQLFIENLEGNVTFRSYETFGDMTGNGDKTPMVAGGYLFFSYNLSDTVEETQNYIASIARTAAFSGGKPLSARAPIKISSEKIIP